MDNRPATVDDAVAPQRAESKYYVDFSGCRGGESNP